MAIIQDITTFRKYLPLLKNSSTERIPNTEIAETDHLVPILGMELYTELVTAVEEENLTAVQTALLAYCQSVVAPFAYLDELPLMQTTLDTNGLVVMESEMARRAHKWEYNNTVEALTNRGYAAQERLILFLKSKADDYPSWANSSYNDDAGFLLIRSGEDLRYLYTLSQPHRSYMLLRALLLTSVAEYIKSAISEAYYLDLNSRIKSDALTDAEKEIINNLRAAAAWRVMHDAAVTMNIKFAHGNGFTIAKEVKEQPIETVAAADQQRVEIFKQEMAVGAEGFLAKAVAYMNKHASATVFTKFYESEQYQDPNATTKPLDNTGKRIFRC